MIQTEIHLSVFITVFITQAVEAGKANNSFADGWSPIASHYKKITLAPGESKTLVFILG